MDLATLGERDLSQRFIVAQRAAKGDTAYGIAKALGLDRHTAAKYMQT
jgi:hypothetical protein